MLTIWKKSLLAGVVFLIFAGSSFAGEKKELSFDEMMTGHANDKAITTAEKEAPKKVYPPAPKKKAEPKGPAPKKTEAPPSPVAAVAEKVEPQVVSPSKKETPAPIAGIPVEAVSRPSIKTEPSPQPKAVEAEEAKPQIVLSVVEEEESATTNENSKEAAPVPAVEQPAAPPPSKWFETVNVSGLVDAYYTYNGNGYRGMGDNQYLGFSPDSNEFSAALFELNFEKKPTAERPAGFYVGLMAGTTPYLIDQAGDKTVYSGLLRQAYGSLLIAQGMQLDIGKYVTLMGAEVIESNTNWNYTRSILFSYAEPVLHSGARLTYTVNEALYIQGHIINGWNNVINHTGGKGVCVQVGVTPIKPLPIVLNYMTGSESAAANAAGQLDAIGTRSLFDAVATLNAADTLSFMVNYDNGTQSNGSAAGGSANWSGVAGYAKYSGAMPFLSAIAIRYEVYEDTDGFTTGTKQTLNEGTITLEKAVDGALLRLDIRKDSSNQNVFTVSDGTTSQSQLTATFGAVFAF